MPKWLLYIRIAISATGGVVCLLMIAWWVRSYWWADGGFVKLAPSEHIQFHAAGGRMCVWFEHKPINLWFDWRSRPITTLPPPGAENRIPWFALHFWPTMARLYTAHWFLAVLAGTLAVMPWCPRRFTLRTLLAATTAIAAVTCIIVWVDQTF